MSPVIAIVDYGAGNLTSVARALNWAGATVRIASAPSDIDAVSAIVVPGVGHFNATARLDVDWRSRILRHVGQGRPLLGICLGMQWLFEGSDETPGLRGLGVFGGQITKLQGPVKIPHSGWNTVERTEPSRLLFGCTAPLWAYFTHGYAIASDADGVVARTTYGQSFGAIVERGVVFGTQFHPEKSGAPGQQLLATFVAIAEDRHVPMTSPDRLTQSRSGAGHRLIACLDVKDGLVVKGVQFGNLRLAGDPGTCARAYNDAGIDELVVLDVTATLEARGTLLETVRAVSRELTVPLAVGGGIRSEQDARDVLDAGADKVCVNSAALREPALITRLAAVYGSQAVVVAIDADQTGRVFSRSGSAAESRQADGWAREAVDRGAGEILLTSIDRDGTRAGFDCRLTAGVSSSVSVPVIASGGAGRPEHFAEVFTEGGADAALAASVFHFGDQTICELKQYLVSRGVTVRPC